MTDWKRVAGGRLKTIGQLIEENNQHAKESGRLNRLMPHTGETCKWNDGKSFADLSIDEHKCPNGCFYDQKCHNDNWELKE